MRNWDMTSCGKPFYIEVGTCLVAIRGTATNDLIYFWDHHKHGKGVIEVVQDICELMNENCEKFNASTRKESLQVGNTAKMREALKQAQQVLHCAIVAGILKGEDAHGALDVVTAALSEPPRNCDVGTAEEQEERYIKLKMEHTDKLTHCPAVGQSWFPDSLYWAQMEYEGEVDS